MRVLIQRVKKAHVSVHGKIVGKINKGLLIFLGIHKNDTISDSKWLVNKCVNLRVFPDKDKKMNLSLKDIDGKALIISQFTLYGNCTQGRRPEFTSALTGEKAELIYDQFVKEIKTELTSIETGVFGAKMEVELLNDGPVTFIIDGK